MSDEVAVLAFLAPLVREGWCGLADRYPEAGDAFFNRGHQKVRGFADDPEVQRATAETLLGFLDAYGIDPLPEVMAVALPDGSLGLLVRRAQPGTGVEPYRVVPAPGALPMALLEPCPHNPRAMDIPRDIRSHAKRPDENNPTCAHPKCRNKVTPEDHCSGCGEFICDKHSSNPDVRWGNHPASEHWQEDES